MSGEASLAERLARLDPADRATLFDGIGEAELDRLVYDWRFWARPKQQVPDGNWFCWLVIAGRGFGKTRMGAEWVRGLLEGPTPLTAPPGAPARIALVADTEADGRDVMIDGESGLRRCAWPGYQPDYQASRRRLVWPNGAVAQLYSAAEPDQLRGPQHHAAWGDEVAKWAKGSECWANLQFGLRLGAKPRVMLTTTPRPIRLLGDILDRPDTVVTRGTTFENRSNIAPVFFDRVVRPYQGTRLGRQELMGEILDDVPGALWSRRLLDGIGVDAAPVLERVVVAVDPPVSSGERADSCGIVAAGRGVDGKAYVLADRTVSGLTPHRWALAALETYPKFRGRPADRRGQQRRRSGRGGDPPGRSGGELPRRSCQPRQGDPSRTCRGALRTRPGPSCPAHRFGCARRRVRTGTVGGRDVQFCIRPAGDRAEPGPRGCAGLGADRLDAAAGTRSAHTTAQLIGQMPTQQSATGFPAADLNSISPGSGLVARHGDGADDPSPYWPCDPGCTS